MEYYYAWKNNEKRETLYKRACRVLARGRMNSCLIEFENGQRECVSRNAVKRLTKRAVDLPSAAVNHCVPVNGVHAIFCTGHEPANQ